MVFQKAKNRSGRSVKTAKAYLDLSDGDALAKHALLLKQLVEQKGLGGGKVIARAFGGRQKARDRAGQKRQEEANSNHCNEFVNGIEAIVQFYGMKVKLGVGLNDNQRQRP